MSAPRLPYGLLLAAGFVPFLPGLMAIGPFVAWGLAGAALVVAYRQAHVRRPALAALLVLVALVVGTLVGSGITLGRTGLGLPDRAWEDLAMAFALAAIWLPSGIYAALTAGGPAARAAATGATFIGAWLLVYGGQLVYEARVLGGGLVGEAHIVLLIVGALLVMGALAWRIARPQRPPPAPVADAA